MKSGADYIDNALLLRIREGDETALRILYDEYFPTLMYFAEGLIHDRSQAEDIVVVSFTKYWERRRNFYEIAAVKSFLYTTVRNGCYKFYGQLKRKDRRLPPIAEHQFASDDYIESRIAMAEMVQLIHREVEHLNPKYKEVIQLLFMEELSIQEAAIKTNITPVNVRKRKERAIELLRSRILNGHPGSLTLFYLIISSKMP